MRRLLVTLAVAAGLFAMHGLAAPTGHAAQCGAVVAHEHASPEPVATDPSALAGLGVPTPSGGPDGLLLACVALLVGLMLVGSARRLASGLDELARDRYAVPVTGAVGRAPPKVLALEDICVWRT
jgi:hypothetical protein